MEDPDFLIKLEKAIKEKYGEEAIQHPSANWTEEKEKKYINQLADLAKKMRAIEANSDKEQHNGFLIPKKLIKRDSSRTCPICEVYSFDFKDDLYMNKFVCCFNCYVKWIEGREERWKSGWRPPKEDK
jgi:hypothetical protein